MSYHPMALSLTILTVSLFLPALSYGCDTLAAYPAEISRPDPDLGVVPGESPTMPEVVRSFVVRGTYNCSGCDTCCKDGDYSYLRVELVPPMDAYIYEVTLPSGRVAYVMNFPPGNYGKLHIGEPETKPPFTFDLVAYNRDGYRSKTTTVSVDRVEDNRSGGCTATGQSEFSLLALVSLLRRGLRQRT